MLTSDYATRRQNTTFMLISYTLPISPISLELLMIQKFDATRRQNTYNLHVNKLHINNFSNFTSGSDRTDNSQPRLPIFYKGIDIGKYCTATDGFKIISACRIMHACHYTCVM